MLLFTVAFAMAQKTITGNVSDENGPLIGANVLAKGTTAGTITDIDGNFTLDVPSETTTLVFSYLGYNDLEYELGNSTNVSISMSSSTQLLEEVVVTATGIERNARNTVYANQTVSSEKLLNQPNKNALEALRGKAAGVRINTSSGSVGSSSRIVLRGEGSLTGNNNALIVVDGIPIDNATSSGGAGGVESGYSDYGNRFNDLNPEDIESVTVLKGPSATSLYGSRGASGVLVITTKKGGGGKDGNVEVGFNTSASLEQAYVLTQRQDQFGQGYDRSSLDSGENWSWGPPVDGVVRPWTSAIDVDGDGQLEALSRPYSNVPDQLQSFFNVGNTLNNSIYLSGSKEMFTYYLSYANARQDGILDNTSYDRNSINLNASAKFSEKFKTDFKVAFTHTDQKTATEGSRAFEGDNAYAMVLQSPITIPFNEMRDYNSPWHDINGYWGSYSSVNPYYILNEYGNEGKINNFLTNFSFTYTPIENLDLIARVGANIVNTDIDQWTPSYTPELQYVWGNDLALSSRSSRHESVGSYSNGESQRTNLDITALANYSRTLDANGDFELTATAGYNLFERVTESITGQTVGGLVVPGWFNLSNSVGQANSFENSTHYRIYGLLGNVSVGYKNAIFLEYSARNDWSSTLPKENNSFFYQAIGASAVVTEFLDTEGSVLDFLKLRGSLGTTGKDAGLYLLQSTFIGNPNLVNLGDYTITFPLNGQAGFTTSNRIGNPGLKPELTTTFEIGADIGLFNSRINLEYTYYSSTHSDQIVVVNLPNSTGYTNTTANIGEMTNKGHELALTIKPIDGLVRGLTWDINLLYAKNDNKVTKVTDDIDELTLGGIRGMNAVAKEGLPFGTWKGLEPLTNDAGQVIVGATGFPEATVDEQYFDSYQPDYTAGLGTEIGYKGLSFNILFDVKQGGSFYSSTQFYTEFNGTALHTAEFDRLPFVVPNSVIENADGSFSPNTIEVNEQDYFTNYDPLPSTYLVDASYVKLRELGLSYRLPSSLLNKSPFKSAKISLFAKNLKFWLPAENTYGDPEVNGPGLTGNYIGVETTQTPPSKSFGVNLGFTF
jgi:TonB-linked SusC/RagA family outer membrane protein